MLAGERKLGCFIELLDFKLIFIILNHKFKIQVVLRLQHQLGLGSLLLKHNVMIALPSEGNPDNPGCCNPNMHGSLNGKQQEPQIRSVYVSWEDKEVSQQGGGGPGHRLHVSQKGLGRPGANCTHITGGWGRVWEAHHRLCTS